MRIRVLTAAAAAAFSLAACSSIQQHERVGEVPQGEMDAYLADKAPDTKRLYTRVLLEGKRNEVLNHMRAGLAAMQVGDHDNAVRSFDTALGTIEAIYADNPQANEARSVWTKENVKDFKGEPYERALAYYYRGLLYIQDGDYENARASFKGGILQTAMSYNERFTPDFALLNFLEGWAARCAGAGNIANDSFDAAQKIDSALAAPPSDHSVLLLAEIGHPPRKVAKGKNKELLAFEPGLPAREQAVAFVGAGGNAAPANWRPPLWPSLDGADVYRQASTRGGRPIDGILEGKAQIKDTTKVASTVAVGVGAAMMTSNNSNVQAAGAIFALGGLIGAAIADAMRPEADVRAWDNIPGQIKWATLPSDALAGAQRAEQPLEVEAMFLDHDGVEIGRKPVGVKTAGRCTLGWVRARSALAIPDSAPGAIGVGL
jgi:tetratricopeptide (TPR) repeat protein